MSTYYEILEVSENASQEVIKASYRALARKFHPDVYVGDKGFANEQLKVLNAAYEVLSDPVKREVYDSYLKSAFYRADADNTMNFDQGGTDTKRNQNKKNESSYTYNTDSSDESNEKDSFHNQESTDQTVGTEYKDDAVNKRKQSKFSIGKLLIVVFVIIGLLLGLYYIQDSNNQSAEQDQNTEVRTEANAETEAVSDNKNNANSSIALAAVKDYVGTDLEDYALNNEGAKAVYGWDTIFYRFTEDMSGCDYIVVFKVDLEDNSEANGYSMYAFVCTVYKDGSTSVKVASDQDRAHYIAKKGINITGYDSIFN